VKLQDNPKAYAIMGCAMRVHKTLGHGFLESAYGDALELEFQKNSIPYVREDEVYVYYEGTRLQTRYRADFTCFDRGYIVELKAMKALTKIEWAQTIHYLRATRIPYALLINFGRPDIQYETFELAKLPSA
jgi:GxxExxY protein